MPDLVTHEADWEKRFERERRARKSAEAILEKKSLDLYEANQNLQQARDELEARVTERTRELAEAIEKLQREARERSKAEAELLKARSQLLDAIETLDGGLAMYDSEEKLVVCNSRFKQMYYQAAQALVPGASKESFLREFCKAGGYLESGLSAEEWILQRLADHRSPVSETFQKLGNHWIRINDRQTGDGGVVSLRTDITAFKEIQEAAEAASHAKTQFLANMSHEFRTPVAAVVGYAEMLLDPHLGVDERMRIVHSMTRNGRHLLALISDVLDLAKIEAGKLELERVPCNLWRIITEALSVSAVIAQEKTLEISAVPVGRIPKTITADPTRFRQILDNLLTNAVKFTGPGKRVDLRVKLQQNSLKDIPQLMIEVEDQGIGMGSDVLSRIFKPFTQADLTTTRRFGGTGLGLSICKRFAESMGGDIQVRSQPGVGSCFTLSIPVDSIHLSDLVDKDDLLVGSGSQKLGWSQFEGKVKGTVLLAEDNIDNRNIISFFLERGGLTVEAAENGRIAVEKALGQSFDLILMDMQMPEVDGYSATRTLRQCGIQKPIIALTAHAMAEDEEKCIQAGCSAYLSKPVDPEKLLSLIHSHLESKHDRLKAESLKHGDRSVGDQTHHFKVKEDHYQDAEDPSLEELVDAFRNALPMKVQTIGARFQENDFLSVASLAHQLRGAAGMYGFGEVSFLAGLIEDTILREKDQDTTRLLIGQLETMVDKLVQGLA